MSIRLSRFLACVAVGVCAVVLAIPGQVWAQPKKTSLDGRVQDRVLVVDAGRVRKDLANSRLGTAALQFRSHYCIKQMLDRPDEFRSFLSAVGSPVLRLDGREVYGWSGPEEHQRRLVAAEKMRVLNRFKDKFSPEDASFQPDDYARLVKKYSLRAPADIQRKGDYPAWIPLEEFHRFCRKNGVRLIGAFDDEVFFDASSGRVVRFEDNPKYFDAAVEASRKRLAWLKEKGFLDLYVAWEIGNECWASWDPKLYAAYAVKIADMARKIQPDIRLAVPVMLRDTDDPFIRQFIAAQKDRKDWFDWHKTMMPALGPNIRKFSHLQIHIYGSASRYSAHHRGLSTIDALLREIPGTDHFRYLVTEWRYTGRGGVQHRTFRTGSLWNAKFVMLLLAHPKVDYPCAHDFLCTSGLGYWTPGTGNAGAKWDGASWIFQYPDENHTDKTPWLRSRDGQPRFDVGPFGPVTRMFNELIADCPMLLQHASDLGPMSSALFADGFREPQQPEGSTDLDWIVCASADRSRIGGLLVNTTTRSMRIALNTGRKACVLGEARQMTCDADKWAEAETPGEAKFWRVAAADTAGGKILLPPRSITAFRGVLK